MFRVLLALSTTLVFLPLQALAQPDMEHGFPISDSPSGDLPCHMISSTGYTLDLAKLCGGTPQASRVRTPQTQSGLVISNISFRNASRAERTVRGWAKLIDGTLTNRSDQPIRARVINYDITAFNGRQREVVVNNSEFLSTDFEPVTLMPGQSIRFTHSLDSAQMASMNKYMLSPDIFALQIKNTQMEFIDKLPVKEVD